MISLLKRKRCRPGLLGIEKIGLIYAIFTAVVALIFWKEMPTLGEMMLTRVGYLLGMLLLMFVYRKRPCHLTFFLRTALQLGMLAVWYPETYLFCRIFGNFDHVFANIDQFLFGFQPALKFSEAMPGAVWCELFNLGYFSYYPMIFALVLWTFFRKYLLFEKTAFIVLCSFFIFYIVFMFLPVAGPQFYYNAIGLNAVRSGVFPEVGLYFRDHFEMIAPPEGGGLFQYLVEKAPGERGTSNGCIPEFTRRNQFYNNDIGMESRQEKAHVPYHAAVLRALVFCHSLYPRPLRHRCNCRASGSLSGV